MTGLTSLRVSPYGLHEPHLDECGYVVIGEGGGGGEEVGER